MTDSHRDRRTGRPGRTAASVVVWNTVVPGLAVALLLGAPVLLALLVAAVLSLAIAAVVAPPVHASGRAATSAPAPSDG